MLELIQIVGAILILVPFVAAQRGTMSAGSLAYLWLNLIGATTLAVLAAIGTDWGFLLLEAVWALVSAWSLIERGRGRPVRVIGH
jgi:hypothetical protein